MASFVAMWSSGGLNGAWFRFQAMPLKTGFTILESPLISSRRAVLRWPDCL